jgi:heme a synthase
VQASGPTIAEGLSASQRRQLATWLGICSGWVFALVVLGGITRLTRSGLSMTEWKFTGSACLSHVYLLVLAVASLSLCRLLTYAPASDDARHLQIGSVCKVWSLDAGERPPLSIQDWEVEFAKYRESPEFRKLNSKMSMDEFKFIYWMEYAHRMWGRALGLVFAIPAAWFASQGCIRGPLAQRLAILMAMGGAQVCHRRWPPKT